MRDGKTSPGNGSRRPQNHRSWKAAPEALCESDRIRFLERSWEDTGQYINDVGHLVAKINVESTHWIWYKKLQQFDLHPDAKTALHPPFFWMLMRHSSQGICSCGFQSCVLNVGCITALSFKHGPTRQFPGCHVTFKENFAPVPVLEAVGSATGTVIENGETCIVYRMNWLETLEERDAVAASEWRFVNCLQTERWNNKEREVFT